MNKKIDGINVKTFGRDTNQAIVFIHGFPFDNTLWRDVIDKLKDAYYCISYDIRGFGESETSCAQYTMESYAKDLESVISQLELKKPILCGFSMGGYVALRANEKQKENYKALILANTATNSDNDEAKLKRATTLMEIDAKGVEPFLDGFFSVAFSEDFTQKELLEKLKNKIMSFNEKGIKGGLLAMISRTDTTKSLKNIAVPVLLISGENDKIISAQSMQEMASKIKNSKLVTLSGSGHMSMLEHPDHFYGAIREFLETL